MLQQLPPPPTGDVKGGGNGSAATQDGRPITNGFNRSDAESAGEFGAAAAAVGSADHAPPGVNGYDSQPLFPHPGAVPAAFGGGGGAGGAPPLAGYPHPGQARGDAVLAQSARGKGVVEPSWTGAPDGDSNAFGGGGASRSWQQGQPEQGNEMTQENGESMSGDGVGVVDGRGEVAAGPYDSRSGSGSSDEGGQWAWSGQEGEERGREEDAVAADTATATATVDVTLSGPPRIQWNQAPPQRQAAREDSSPSSVDRLVAPPLPHPGQNHNPYRSVGPNAATGGRGGGAWAAGRRSNPFGAVAGPFGGGGGDGGAGGETAAEIMAPATMTGSVDAGSVGGSDSTSYGESVSSFGRFDAGGVVPPAEAASAAKSATMAATAVGDDSGGDACGGGGAGGGEGADVAEGVAGMGDAGTGNVGGFGGFGAPSPWARESPEADDYFGGGV